MLTLYGGNYIQCLPEIMSGDDEKNNSIYTLILNSDIDRKKLKNEKQSYLVKSVTDNLPIQSRVLIDYNKYL